MTSWGYGQKVSRDDVATAEDLEEDEAQDFGGALEEEDLDLLRTYGDQVRESYRLGQKQEEVSYEALRTMTDKHRQKLEQKGCKTLLMENDGPHYDLVVQPPLPVMLNLCGTLLDNVEVMWTLIRRGMAEVQRREKRGMVCSECGRDWKSQPNDCRIRVCEMTNTCIHEHCWKEHLKKQTWQ